MDSGWAAIIGAFVGGAASLGATFLPEWLRGCEARKLDTIRQDVLRRRLQASNKKWVPIDKLMAHVGGDRDNTIRLLLLIGARRSMNGNDVWGFNDWPEPSN